MYDTMFTFCRKLKRQPLPPEVVFLLSERQAPNIADMEEEVCDEYDPGLSNIALEDEITDEVRLFNIFRP